jgi:hypothetical protein
MIVEIVWIGPRLTTTPSLECHIDLSLRATTFEPNVARNKFPSFLAKKGFPLQISTRGRRDEHGDATTSFISRILPPRGRSHC